MHDLFLNANQSSLPEISKEEALLRSACSDTDTVKTKQIPRNISHLMVGLENSLYQLISKRRMALPTFKVMRIYIYILLTLLQFIRPSQQGDWVIHLTALEKLHSSFFSENSSQYAHNMTEYLAKMYSPQVIDPDVWEQFCNGNVCIKNSGGSRILTYTCDGVRISPPPP